MRGVQKNAYVIYEWSLRWLENSSQNNCSHCRKSCTKNQLIKLFFSEIQFSLQDSTTNELKLSLEVNELRMQLIQETQKNLKIEQVKLKLISETKRHCKKLTDEAKGQLISKCFFGIFISTTLTCQIIVQQILIFFGEKAYLHNLIRTYIFINFRDF